LGESQKTSLPFFLGEAKSRKEKIFDRTGKGEKRKIFTRKVCERPVRESKFQEMGAVPYKPERRGGGEDRYSVNFEGSASLRLLWSRRKKLLVGRTDAKGYIDLRGERETQWESNEEGEKIISAREGGSQRDSRRVRGSERREEKCEESYRWEGREKGGARKEGRFGRRRAVKKRPLRRGDNARLRNEDMSRMLTG